MIAGKNMSGQDAGGETGNIGQFPVARQVLRQAHQVAASKVAVLIRGESGVGKGWIAERIHRDGPRAGKPFIRVSCAGLSESAIERALFGSENGALAAANGGTLFLDEIGDLAPATQIKLLRVLQEHEFERLDSDVPIPVNVRVVASTSRPLEQLMRAGRFRDDLYYELNVFPIYVPPLRERKADIPLLIDFFIASISGGAARRLSPAAVELLTNYDWPGNVRELENCVRYALVSSPAALIESQHVIPFLQAEASFGAARSRDMKATMGAVERAMIADALEANHGHMGAAARQLGLTLRILSLRVHKYGIDPASFKRR